MKLRLITLFSLSLIACDWAASQAVSPAYAIYGIKNTSAESQVTSVNVGVIPSGNQAECSRQIEVYEQGMRKRGLPASVQLIPSKCTAALSPDLQAMVQGKRIKNVYVVVASGEWAPVFTAWYNVPTSDPITTCKKLIDGMRATLSPGKANLDCRPPL